MITTDSNLTSTPLSHARMGMTGTLSVADDVNSTVQRLMAMGLMPGDVVTVVRIAPLGDPIMLESRGCQVSLRKHEAEGLAIQSLDV